MAGGLSAKQELFCLKYLELGTACDAYDAAYPSETRNHKTSIEKGSKLLARPEIRARIEQLSGEVAKKVVEQSGIDAAWVLASAVDLYKKAMDDGAYAPAKGALELIGKHVNVQAFREQHEHRLGLTTQEARATIANLAAKYLGK